MDAIKFWYFWGFKHFIEKTDYLVLYKKLWIYSLKLMDYKYKFLSIKIEFLSLEII